jgi:hypothetical protein
VLPSADALAGLRRGRERALLRLGQTGHGVKLDAPSYQEGGLISPHDSMSANRDRSAT